MVNKREKLSDVEHLARVKNELNKIWDLIFDECFEVATDLIGEASIPESCKLIGQLERNLSNIESRLGTIRGHLQQAREIRRRAMN